MNIHVYGGVADSSSDRGTTEEDAEDVLAEADPDALAVAFADADADGAVDD